MDDLDLSCLSSRNKSKPEPSGSIKSSNNNENEDDSRFCLASESEDAEITS